MNENVLVVVDQLTASRKIIRRTSYVFGFTSIAAPIFFIVSTSAWQAARDNSVINVFVGISAALAAATPTMLALAFTFLPIALALRSRTKLLKLAIQEETSFDAVVKKLKNDSRVLFLLGIVLALIVIVPAIIYFATKDIRIPVPLGPGECCLQPDGTSGETVGSPWTYNSILVLYLLGLYSTIMGSLSFVAASLTNKRAKQLSSLIQVD
jgi:hypothetical protein